VRDARSRRPPIAALPCRARADADGRTALDAMPRATDERYSVYTVEEFLDDRFCTSDTSLPASEQSSRGTPGAGALGARRRELARRLLGLVMLSASVGTVAALVGANLLRDTASLKRGRAADASVGSPARSVDRGSIGNRRHAWPLRGASTSAPDDRAMRSATPVAARRIGRPRLRRARSRAQAKSPAQATSPAGGRVAWRMTRDRPPSRAARVVLIAAATATEPRRSSAEFGFER
jgi:hypothetical protein